MKKVSLEYIVAAAHHRNHMGKRLSIPKDGFLFDIYNDKNRHISIMKSTQCGISEYLIVKSLVNTISGKNVLYVLPSYGLMGKFVKDRIDKSIFHTPAYQAVYLDIPHRFAESVSMKQIGNGTIHFVGSNSETSFISVPSDDIIIDELDSCDQVNILMAEERQSASIDKSIIFVGNPTVTNRGIDKKYKDTCQKEWHVKCDRCGKYIVPDFFKHVMKQTGTSDWIVIDKSWDDKNDINAKTFCHLCGKPFNRFNKGKWIQLNPGNKNSGYHVSKMFSTQNTVNELIKRFSDGLSNDHAMQRFYNGDLGLPYVASGAKIDMQMIQDCIDEKYNMPASSMEPCIAGIDVGGVFHIVISEAKNGKVVFIGELQVKNIKEVFDLFQKYNVRLFVIDALPETRIARQIVALWKYGFMNYYSETKNELTINAKDGILSSNRTIALDAVKESIVLKSYVLPVNSKSIKGFFEQMTSSTRIYDEDKNCFYWVESGPDHYLHAFCYMNLAKKLLVMAQ